MYHRQYSITPTQQAINGGLDIFVGGCRSANLQQQLFGLSILQSGTEAQVQAAMPFAQASQGISAAEIGAMLAR